MTRDEAAEIFGGLKAHRHMPGEEVGRWIDSFVALGILKIDEPKNPEMRAGEIINAYVTGGDTAAILMELSDAGLQIIEKGQ